MKNEYNNYQNLSLNVENVKFSILVYPYFEYAEDVSESEEISMQHSHMHYEFFYVESGVFFQKFENGTVTLSMGDCIIVPPNVPHYSYSIDSSARVHVISFDFSENKCDSNTNLYMEMRKEFTDNKYIFVSGNKKIGVIISEFYEYYLDESAEKNNLVSAKFCELIFYIKSLLKFHKKLGECGSKSYEDYSCYLIDEYISCHFNDQDIALKTLEEKVYISRTQINRILKKKTGLTFKQYVIKLRMENAAKLLKNTKRKVNDIAESLGYTSLHGFYIIFKRMYGVTPDEYRKTGECCKKSGNNNPSMIE